MVDVAVRDEAGAKLGPRQLVLPTLLVVGVTLLLYGSPVPRLNEELYLPLVKRVADPGYLRGDWTLGAGFGEHWLFNHLFAPLAGVLSVSAFGWIGRLVLWPVLGVLLIRVGMRFGLSIWPATFAVCFWLVSNQSLIGNEWILGGLEAKMVAYVCLLGALLAATSRRIPLALALLGLTVSFHPAVGFWSALAFGAALLVLPDTRRTTLRWCWLALLLAVPGIIGALSAIGDASPALQRFVVLEALPFHTDPFFGGKTWGGSQVVFHLSVLLAMFAFNLWWYSKSDHDLSQRFFAAFQIAAAVPFALAYPARVLHVWDYLRLMPLRSFPLIVPLIFYFQAFAFARRLAARAATNPRGRRRAIRDAQLVLAATLVIAIVPTTPLFAGPRMISHNIGMWVTVDHEADAFTWVRENTPKDTTCVFPVDRQDSFARAERPQVANWQAITYDRLADWRSRIDDLVGGPEYFSGSGWHGDPLALRDAYNELTTAQIDRIAAKYDASCLVSETQYPYQLLHRDGPFRVYALEPF